MKQSEIKFLNENEKHLINGKASWEIYEKIIKTRTFEKKWRTLKSV